MNSTKSSNLHKEVQVKLPTKVSKNTSLRSYSQLRDVMSHYSLVGPSVKVTPKGLAPSPLPLVFAATAAASLSPTSPVGRTICPCCKLSRLTCLCNPTTLAPPILFVLPRLGVFTTGGSPPP